MVMTILTAFLGTPNNMYYNIYIRSSNCDQNEGVKITIGRRRL